MTRKDNIQITKEIIDAFCFKNYPKGQPSYFIKKCWTYYKENYKSNPSMNGTIFENLIAYILAYEGISYIYEQAEISFVPNALFDIFLYSPDRSYALSLKTSLRERWKQADLEAYALKSVIKDAQCYVLTLAEKEVQARRNKYDKKEDFYNGLDGFVLVHTHEFDQLVEELKKISFTESDTISIVKESQSFNDLDGYREKFDL